MREKRLQRNVLSRYVLAAALSCSAFSSLSALPEAPSIDRSVTEIQGLGNGSNAPAAMTRPYIPVNHTTGDGRVSIDIKPLSSQNRVEFYLYVPEKLNTPFLEATPGPVDIMWTGQWNIDLDTFVSEIVDSGAAYEGDIRHVTLIDRTREFDPDGTSQSNPRNVGGQDVYDLLVYATLDWNDAGRFGNANSPLKGYLKMQTTPITVYVSNPKTASAAISNIVVDPTGNGKEASSDFIHIARLFENKFTHDGKLMVARVGVFTPDDPQYFAPDGDGNDPATSTNFMDTVYAYSSDGSLDGDPSDNRDGFDNIIPISYAPYDPRVNGEYLNDGLAETVGGFYAFAAFPFRDGSGMLIPPGEDFGGSYPWIDSDGRTLAMSTVRATLNDDNSNPRYPNTRFDASQTENLVEDGGPFQNQSIVGLWTQGKLVAMDNSLNNTDYGIGKELDEHRWVTLYQSGVSGLPITDGRIRVGSGRDNNNIQMHGGAGNTTFFDTIENRFSYNENLRTVMPRDVVWWVSNGKSTAQFAFDDYLNKDSFIVSKMTGALEFDPSPNGSGRFFYYDGWNDATDAFTEAVRVANDACAIGDTVASEAISLNSNSPIRARWNIPANGLVTGPGARLEPIAHGGIEGKGLWLDSGNGIEYTIPGSQPTAVDQSNWYFGLFVDSREPSTEERSLISFPDGSSINLLGREFLRLRDAGGNTFADSTITLPDFGSLEEWQRNEWRHFGFQLLALDGGSYALDFYHNGFLAHSFTLPAKMFQLEAGTLTVGKVSGAVRDGYRGWYDDFKVFAQDFGPEVCANLARGTLVSFPGSHALRDRADLYAGSMGRALVEDMLYHSGQIDIGSLSNTYYAVHHDYTTHDGAHKGNIPSGTTSIRDNLVFPEAPLFNNTHRPDSSQNSFCSSCHDDTNPAKGLQKVALDLQNGILATDDPRRQPVQSLRRVFGNIPADWLGNNAPASAFVTSSDGALIDEMELASQNAGSRVVRSLSLTDSTGFVEERIEGGPIFFVSGDRIRANLDAAQGSVRFQILNTGTSTVVRTLNANEAPYAIDVPTDLSGTYDITATPFANDNGGGTEGVSYTVTGVTFDDGVGGPTLPAAPSGLGSSSVTSSSVTLQWTDNSGNEDSFRIQRRVSGGTFSTLVDLGANAISYTDDTVAASTSYDYRVRSSNVAGSSAYSNTHSVTTPAGGTVPAIPGSLQVTGFDSSSISLSWVDNSGNEDGFRIARSVNGGIYATLVDLGADQTSYTDPELAASTSYSYRVAAFNGTGTSIYSNVASQTTSAGGGGGLTEILFDDFEGGFGNWVDGGQDASLYTGGEFAASGNNAANLQDNDPSSVISTNNLALSGATEVRVEFNYVVKSFEAGEDFWLQISTDGGSSYQTVATWAEGSNLTEDVVVAESYTITGVSLNNTTRLRFRCDASGNADDVYLDDIRVLADVGGGGGGTPVTSVSLSASSASMNEGATATPFTATVNPANADDDSVVWDSSNPAVASINPSTGEVNALVAGTTTITVTTNDGGFQASATLTVNAVGGGGLTPLIADDFEGGIGPNWNDGGSDCLHYTGTDHSPSGSGSMRLRDDTSTSVMTTDSLPLASATEVQVEFSYKAVNLNGAEDFWLQVSTDGGATYVTVEEWNLGDEFNNDDVNSDSVTITNAILGSLGLGNLSNQTRIRFRCDASANNDSIYLDDIIVSADI